MEAYVKALLWAIPSFQILILIEIIYGHFSKKQTYTFMDTISSLSSGLTNILKNSLGLVIVLVSYPWLVSHLALFKIQTEFWLYIVAFICIDFAGYWTHRLNHRVNIFWNQHIIHHSSEEFNLACALRQSISNVFGYTALFLIPAAFLGVPYEIIALLSPLHFFAQFWYHTRHIGKLGFLEYIIVTPSQHRVHHAINSIYIDKNLGAVLCVWDRWFGTFQEELEEVPPVYGVLKPVHTWNPFIINFQHLWGLMKDTWYARNWLDKMLIWFKPTGWRPKDVANQFPRPLVSNVYELEKHNPKTTGFTKAWALFQLLCVTILLMLDFANIENIDRTHHLGLGILLFLSIFGFTSVMDNHSWAFLFEVVCNTIGIIYFLLPLHHQYYIDTAPTLYYAALIYFVLTLVSLFFIKRS